MSRRVQIPRVLFSYFNCLFSVVYHVYIQVMLLLWCLFVLMLFVFIFFVCVSIFYFFIYLWESTQCCRWTGGAALAGAAGDHAVLGPEARASMDLIADQFVPSAEGALGLDVCLSVSALGRGGGVD